MRRSKHQQIVALASEVFSDVPPDGIQVKSMGPFRQELFRGLLADFILWNRVAGEARNRVLVILLERLSASAEHLVREYAARHWPDLCCLVVDDSGRAFACRNGSIEAMSFPETASAASGKPHRARGGSLFSPNNQWLLKVLLLGGIGHDYWGGLDTGNDVFGVSHLAELASKPQPSVSRFVILAESEGHLSRDAGPLRDNLHNRYRDEFCILKELVQNANDAGARRMAIGWARQFPSSGHPLCPLRQVALPQIAETAGEQTTTEPTCAESHQSLAFPVGRRYLPLYRQKCR